MKFIVITLTFLISFIFNIKAQIIDLNTGFEYKTSYSNEFNLIEIDSLNKNNIWKIGKFTKDSIFFTSGLDKYYSSVEKPLILATNLNSTYPSNNNSSFIIKVFKGWLPAWNELDLYLVHKYDTDSLHDGGYIEISYDGGKNWANISNDTLGSVERSGGYEQTGKLPNGNYSFTGKTNKWEYSVFSLKNTSATECEAIKGLDSAWVRFTFLSDSIDNKKNGWVILDISIQIWELCYSSVNDLQIKNVFISPNPVSGYLNIETSHAILKPYDIFIFNSQGVLVKKWRTQFNNKLNCNIQDLTRGIYLLKLIDKSKKIIIQKIIIE